jgi:membrane protein
VTATVTRPRGARAKVKQFVDCYVEHDLLTYASAMSFQTLSAIVPFLLFGFSLLGFLQLGDVWAKDLAPSVKSSLSPTGFAFIDDAVRTALGTKQAFWISAGFVIALWEISGAVRAVMGALNTLYRDETRRSWRRRMLISFALGLAVAVAFLLAIAVVVGGTLLYGDVGPVLGALLFLVRWAIAAGVLLLAVAVLLHWAPERHQPLQWVTFGSLLIMGGWVLMSIGFGIYLSDIASYNSIFGSLATIVVLIAYLYAAALVFLGGVQVDALVRDGR